MGGEQATIRIVCPVFMYRTLELSPAVGALFLPTFGHWPGLDWRRWR
jgi:hypothetical protein